ncbi:MAG TPA: hypothetical protein DIV44_12210 [Leeuwenhoekiella sp.]|nr:hypothetical protein [Leeuwenhoekiella sp.]
MKQLKKPANWRVFLVKSLSVLYRNRIEKPTDDELKTLNLLDDLNISGGLGFAILFYLPKNQ